MITENIEKRSVRCVVLAAASLLFGAACSAEPSPEPGPPREERASTAPAPEPPAGNEPSSGSGASCPAPTGTYEDRRTVETVTAPPGPDSPCNVGTYVDPTFTFEPGLHDLPGCTTTRATSADGCTHTSETKCEDETCILTITFEPDMETYAGTNVCRGHHDGVDESGPFECKTTISGKRTR